MPCPVVGIAAKTSQPEHAGPLETPEPGDTSDFAVAGATSTSGATGTVHGALESGRDAASALLTG